MLKLKILIVDDENDYCIIMRNYFQAKDQEVFVASTLEDCLDMLEKNHPDILLLDNNLPDGKAWDHVNEILAKLPSLKIYLISAYKQKSDFVNPPPNVTVWEKPISLSILQDII
jgi:DNA-binding NtrC family response regulator